MWWDPWNKPRVRYEIAETRREVTDQSDVWWGSIDRIPGGRVLLFLAGAGAIGLLISTVVVS